MKRMLPIEIIARVVLMVWFAGGFAVAFADQVERQWSDIVERGRAAGVDATTLQSVMQSCRERGLTAAQTLVVVTPAFEVAREKLPSSFVLEKIMEGITKQVDEEILIQAAVRQATAMKRGHQLLHETLGEPSCRHDELLIAIAHGLESELPEPLFRAVLPSCRNMGFNRLQTLLGAGEMLKLGGVSTNEIQRLLLDFAQRNLGRGQMLRAVQSTLLTKERTSDAKMPAESDTGKPHR
jgi:GH24 family phage-related lysozyme (muramidase)